MYQITITVSVEDASALIAAARRLAVDEDGMTDAEAIQIIDGPEAALVTLFDRNQHNAGVEIEDSRADNLDPDDDEDQGEPQEREAKVSEFDTTDGKGQALRNGGRTCNEAGEPWWM